MFEVINWIYWGIAVIISIIWGLSSIKYMNEMKKAVQVRKNIFTNTFEMKNSHSFWKNISSKLTILEILEAFLSDFLLSFIGWYCLFILNSNIENGKCDNFNIFLGTVSIICITGYGAKLVEKINVGK